MLNRPETATTTDSHIQLQTNTHQVSNNTERSQKKDEEEEEAE